MTELAAGTDTTRNAAISPAEGTAPTPGFPPSNPKADIPDLTSMARQENQMQREEIMTAQNLLKMWYGINYDPHILPENQVQIQILENAAAGADFDRKFMEVLSRHHFIIVGKAAACLVSADLDHLHSDLDRYCRGIVENQLSNIDAMRHILCGNFHICDYQPLIDPKGDFTDSSQN